MLSVFFLVFFWFFFLFLFQKRKKKFRTSQRVMHACTSKEKAQQNDLAGLSVSLGPDHRSRTCT